MELEGKPIYPQDYINREAMMIKKQSAIRYQRSAVSCLSFPDLIGESREDAVSAKTMGLDSCLRRNDYNFTDFNSSEAGFSLVELMITIVVFLLVIAGASQVLTGLITQFKQQSKITETNIEGAIGLEILRRDIEHAGYGLPWVWVHAASNEAINDGATAHDDTAYNDTTVDTVPRALVSGNGAGSGSSDVLVIKAMNVAIWANGASSKWTHLFNGNTVREWTPTTERLETSDRVIVINPATRTLIVSGGSFTTRYWAASAPDSLVNDAFAPPDNTETRVVYGVTPLADPVATELRMPFNRTDYYVRTPGTIPSRCATGTGILYKATVNQSGMAGATAGGLNELPILDCVADMQVVVALDNNENGAFVNGVGGDAYANTLAGLSAENIRNRVKEVRVYVLAHEGQYDRDFTFSGFTAGACATCVRVGLSAMFGRDFDLATSGITNYQNYRWKVYTLVVKPNNLR